jgi:hypothetical protein
MKRVVKKRNTGKTVSERKNGIQTFITFDLSGVPALSVSPPSPAPAAVAPAVDYNKIEFDSTMCMLAEASSLIDAGGGGEQKKQAKQQEKEHCLFVDEEEES